MTTVTDGSYRSRILGLLGERNPLESMESPRRSGRAAARRLGDAGLSRSYGPGKWTGKQILAHLADAETRHRLPRRGRCSPRTNHTSSHSTRRPGRAATTTSTRRRRSASFLASRRWNLALLRRLGPDGPAPGSGPSGARTGNAGHDRPAAGRSRPEPPRPAREALTGRARARSAPGDDQVGPVRGHQGHRGHAHDGREPRARSRARARARAASRTRSAAPQGTRASPATPRPAGSWPPRPARPA